MKDNNIKVAFCGMSHLGIISSVCAAEKGFEVVCYDNDLSIIKKLQEGDLIFSEPYLPELFKKNKERISFTSNAKDILACHIVYISKDVPTDDNGRSDLSVISFLINTIKPAIHSNAIMVILCQIPPGFTKEVVFEKSRLFYQVETLIFGCAVERALKPERIIIGSENKTLPENFEFFLKAYNCPLFLMNYESAELSKIAINMFLISSITTTNTIAELCEKIGASWDDIKPVLQLDKRIGKSAYLNPGLGIAGGNLERDIATFSSLAKMHNTDYSVLETWQKNSKHRKNWVLRKFNEFFLENNKKFNIGILGLSYKENTASIKNSSSIQLLLDLKKHNLYVFDPIVKFLPNLFDFVKIENSMKDVCKKSDLLLIMTPWEDFKRLDLKVISKGLKEKLIIDPYGVLNKKTCEELGLNYFKLGN